MIEFHDFNLIALPQIVAWLRKTLKREDVTFEVRAKPVILECTFMLHCQVTPQSLDKLYSVMRHSQQSVAEAEHVIAAQEDAREEYCVEGNNSTGSNNTGQPPKQIADLFQLPQN